MLSYVWDKTEKFDANQYSWNDNFSSTEILVSIFMNHINDYFKVGIFQEYVNKTEEIKGVKGRINFIETFNNLSNQNAKLVCDFDELDIDNKINRIVKTTAYNLYLLTNKNDSNKRKLNNVLLKLNGVNLIRLNKKDFEIQFTKLNNYSYPLIKVCEFIFNLTMINEENGLLSFYNVFEDNKKLEELFELFIYNFYKKETKNKVYYHKRMNWKFLNTNNWLPSMEMDICIEDKEIIYIIDTKFYKKFYSVRTFEDESYSSKKLISGNLYQIYTYIQNFETLKNVNGILLYPKPVSNENFDEIFELDITSNPLTNEQKKYIRIMTIDLNLEWQEIKANLLSILN